MNMKLRRCKLSRNHQSRLIEFFIGEVTARTAASLIGISRPTATLFYRKLREIIFWNLERDAYEVFNGEIELDESYFGGHRKGKRGRGAAGKIIVFGILKRNGKVYTHIVRNTKTKTLLPIISDKIEPDSIIYTDCYNAYNMLDISLWHHHRINHSTHFAEQKFNHINGIENFWSQAKRILRKYNGIPRKTFHLFIKECEFRFNYGTPKQQIKTLRKWCYK